MKLVVYAACIFFGTATIDATAAMAATVTGSDAFGECVTEEFLDSPGAFSKFSDMPRTCIPDTCADVSMTEYHYEVLGHQPTGMEYDAFLRKQDGVCGTKRARFTDKEVFEHVFRGPPPHAGDHPSPPAVPLLASLCFAVTGILSLVGLKSISHG